MSAIACFKAYDVRGRVPDELDEGIAYRIGRAFAASLGPARVAVGCDVRLSGPRIKAALSEGLRDSGVDVYDIGQCGTEEIYYATAYARADGKTMDGGIMVTASHNPADYNGMKFVRAGSAPVSADSGLEEIRRLAEGNRFPEPSRRGSLQLLDCAAGYIDRLLSYVDAAALKPLKLVVNPGNGGAGAVIDRLAPRLPFEFIRLHWEPDGRFPNGVPNPMLEENRAITAAAVREHGADLGLAWDGDFDRCFFFDETGAFIEGYYLVGLLAESFLQRSPGERIVHDPRLVWNTLDIAHRSGGEAVQSKAGHAFIKETMRATGAIYGGEMSAHHYFRDFAYSDSGMIPWLLVAEHLCRQGQPLSRLVADRMAAFPCSGEINRAIANPGAALAAVKSRYAANAEFIDDTDGISIAFPNWRFNLRPSNTEPLVRLNVESRANPALMREKTRELLELIERN